MRGRQIKRMKIKAGIAVVCLLLPGFAACKKPAMLYHSEAVQAGEKGEEPGSEERESGVRAGTAGEESQETEAQICVYVCGEVYAPGVYELPAQARVADAVDAAGGMTEDAADFWLNLAEHMTDGQKIWVPSALEAEELTQEALEESSGLVNLNSASKEELMTLTGIGESKAKEIVSYREEHGSFSSIEELMQIPGIKEGVFQKIRDQVTV